ncbi:MAG: RND transporter [Ruminococcus sp.]|nr:RND transporter [Ruminococcus sp.]MDE6783849.1 RND transporter [Ruminococcus sp.]
MADIEIKTEDKNNPHFRREVIKTVLIIFLAVLLVLTFCSNTIRNKSLAEISTERTTSGKLTERLRGSGLVESNQSYGVTVDGNKVIDTIMVKTGKEVKKGDVLFTVGTEESEEITDAEDALAALELEYNKLLLTPPADYTEENQAIKNARDDLSAAIAARDKAAANQGNEDAAKQNYQYNKSQLNYYTKLQTKLTAMVTAIDTDEYVGAPAEYTGELITLLNALNDAEKAYNEAVEIYTAMLSGGSQFPEDDEIMTEPGENQSTGRPAGREASATPEETEAARIEMEKAETARDAAKNTYNNRKYELRNEYVAQLEDAENNVDYYTSLTEDYEIGSAGSGMTAADLDDDVRQKQRALEDLIAQLDKTQKENANQGKIDNLDIEAKKKEIEKAKTKIKKLKEENSITEIKAEHSGIVSNINLRAGDETVPDMDVMTIDIAEDGYTVKVTVEAEKTKKIKKGTAAEVVNNWSGDIEAVLMDIRNDTTANSKNRILVFDVTGDVDSGSYIDLSIPCGSGSYDSIVPKSAVHEDSEGKFVLVVESKSSPLGNRYYARRVPVEVQASDEISSAVSGSISNGDYVITAASAPVKAGDQVRMNDQ